VVWNSFDNADRILCPDSPGCPCTISFVTMAVNISCVFNTGKYLRRLTVSMHTSVPMPELSGRMERFRDRMEKEDPDWEMGAIFGRINLYYFTGTMQDGMLLIPRDDEAVLWVRRSYDRAEKESHFPDIRPMHSYRDASAFYGNLPDTVFTETELVPIGMFERFKKYFPFKRVRSLDLPVAWVRALKSPYELSLMRRAGDIHRKVLEDLIPGILREGMSEAGFGSEVYALMVREGHHGVVRFGMFDTEIEVGQLGFGESSIYPTRFNGPGGAYGMCPAVPLLGSLNRTLNAGDLVYIDNACGVEGYQTDKTMNYMFGKSLPDDVIEIHCNCVDILDEMAALLRPGTTPSGIYSTVMETLTPEFRENFMGFGSRRVNFLGHGVGLLVDEIPVIAEGFDDPLQEGMVIALEPKKGIKGVGMVGIENTFLVTPGGGVSITGKSNGLIPVW
jgi:Xaa-Pro dipeptidase